MADPDPNNTELLILFTEFQVTKSSELRRTVRATATATATQEMKLSSMALLGDRFDLYNFFFLLFIY